jgi:hypothetical protein
MTKGCQDHQTPKKVHMPYMLSCHHWPCHSRAKTCHNEATPKAVCGSLRSSHTDCQLDQLIPTIIRIPYTHVHISPPFSSAGMSQMPAIPAALPAAPTDTSSRKRRRQHQWCTCKDTAQSTNKEQRWVYMLPVHRSWSERYHAPRLHEPAPNAPTPSTQLYTPPPKLCLAGLQHF